MKQTSTLFLGFTALISCLGAAAASTPVSRTTVPVSLSQALSIDVAQVPACAQKCAQSLPAECDGNPQCICSHPEFMNEIACCVASSCSSGDLLLTQQFSGQLCGIVGESLPSSPTCTSTVKPVANPGWVTVGCYSEATNYNRALNSTYYIDTNGMTPAACQSFCKARGLKFADVEYGQECWCGNAIQIINGAKKLPNDSQCSKPCTGDSTKMCGGSGTLNIYKSPSA
ncbi:WSC-domain-containing protein [Aureobasidium sp. EXF-10728]|nr:WSC-domain-containing protein [Aureobasidium sp. EXF-10728]